MKHCTVVIPDAGPINSLWVANRLDLLILLDMKIVVLDVIYDELTSEPDIYQKDKSVKDFIDGNQPPFIIETTEKGQSERLKVQAGQKRSNNAGDVALADFITSNSGGLSKYLGSNEPVLLLFEDADMPQVRFFHKPPNLHLLSTVGMLHGMEKVGVIPSAKEIIDEMTHPSNPDKRKSRRKFTDLPDGIDDAAAIGSTWVPEQDEPPPNGKVGGCSR